MLSLLIEGANTERERGARIAGARKWLREAEAERMPLLTHQVYNTSLRCSVAVCILDMRLYVHRRKKKYESVSKEFSQSAKLYTDELKCAASKKFTVAILHFQ